MRQRISISIDSINWWILTPQINMSHYFHSANIEFIHLYDDFKAILIDFDNCLANNTENTHTKVSLVHMHTFTHTSLCGSVQCNLCGLLNWNHISVCLHLTKKNCCCFECCTRFWPFTIHQDIRHIRIFNHQLQSICSEHSQKDLFQMQFVVIFSFETTHQIIMEGKMCAKFFH